MAQTHLLASAKHIPAMGGPCFCCRRRDDGLGFYIHDPTTPLIVWSCREHLPLLQTAIKMSGKKFDFYEQKAIEQAGQKAGAYLDKIGKSDLGTLEKHEWLTFLKTALDAFGDELQKELLQNEPPF